MPLVVVNEVQHGGAATALFWQGFHLGFPYIGDAGMGGFWTSQNAGHGTALVTSGAGPCLIMVVHRANGTGALGHYAAHPDAAIILQGLQAMLLALPPGPVDTILFAAGVVGSGGGAQFAHNQLMYEMQVVAGAKGMAPGAKVIWPAQDNRDNWSAAMYLPHAGQIALFQNFPRSIVGRSGAGNGLAPHGY